MINKVVLRNWKCHEHSELEFSEGTNCLIGIIGAGKTSVLDAICFGLFGTFPQLNQKKIKLEDVITKKPVKKDEAAVEVRFEIDGKEYTVIRRIKKNRTEAEIRCGNVLMEAQPKKVTETVESLLKMNYDLFTRAVYSEQNQLDMFLTIPKGKRMKKIDELLKLDDFEKARASATTLSNRFGIAVAEKERTVSTLSEDPDILAVPELREEIKRIGAEISDLEKRLNSVRTRKDELRARISGLERTEKSISELERSLASVEALSRRLKEEVSALRAGLAGKTRPDLTAIKERISGLEARESEISRKLEDLRKERETLRSERAVVSSRIAEFEGKLERAARLREEIRRLEEIASKKQELEEEAERVRNRIASLRFEISDLKERVEKISGISGRCPTCFRPLDDGRKAEMTRELEEKIAEKENEFRGLNSRYAGLRSELRRVEEAVRSMESARALLDSMPGEEELKSLRKRLEEIGKALEDAETRERVLNGELESVKKVLEAARVELAESSAVFEKFAELEKKESELQGLAARESELREALSSLRKSFSREELDRLRKELERVSAEETEVTASLESRRVLLAEKRRRLEEAERKRENLERERKALERLKFLKEQFSVLAEVLSATQEELRKNFVDSVNRAMHLVWQELYPYGDFSSVRLTVDGDYILQLRDLHGWVSAESVSGGERSLACLALRIAFSLVLAPQLRWLVLDEPTHNLDSKAVEELARVLRERITEFVDQVFLITHEPALEDAVSGYLYRIERDKSRNEPARVVRID